ALAVGGAETGRRGFARERRHRQNQFVTLQRLAPVGEKRLRLREQIERALLDLRLGGRDSVTTPVEPEPATVVVDGLLVARQRPRADGRVAEGLDQGNVDLVAAELAGFEERA